MNLDKSNIFSTFALRKRNNKFKKLKDRRL